MNLLGNRLSGIRRNEKELALSSNGFAYFNTGIYVDSECRVIMDVRTPPTITNTNQWWFGSSGGGESSIAPGVSFGWSWQSTPKRMDARCQWRNVISGIPSATAIAFLPETRYLIDINKNILYVNSGEYEKQITGYGVFSCITAFLIGARNEGMTPTTVSPNLPIRDAGFLIFSAKIIRGEEVVFDAVPVEEGSTVYSPVPAPENCLFDRVRNDYILHATTSAAGKPFDAVWV